MRHGVFGRQLSRDANERKSLLKNLVSSLVTYGYIKTTEAKAKAIKGLVDKLVTLARKDTSQSKILLEAFFQSKTLTAKMVNEIGPSYKNRQSGFTRIIRLGQRLGDQAPMVRLEMVEFDKKEDGSEKVENVKTNGKQRSRKALKKTEGTEISVPSR